MKERRALTEPIGESKPRFRVRAGKGVIGCALLLVSFLLALPACAQSGTVDSEDSLTGTPSVDAFHREIKEKQTRELRKQRYAQVVANTEELLRLATELNAEVSASSSGRLSGSQLRTVARIEKLAREVKENMARPVPAETPPASTPAIALP